jgi:PAS domain S-box-containing protein
MGRHEGEGSEALRRKIAELEAQNSELRAALDDRNGPADAARMLQLVLDTIPVRVFWKDREGRYLGCNTLFARDAGLERPEQLLGKDDFAMGWRDQAELYRADDKAVRESGEAKLNYEEPQTTPDGETIWLRTSKIPLRNRQGEIIGILGTYEDITLQKQLADQSVHRERLEAIGRLAGGVAHDFNNMLTAILGGLDFLEPVGAGNAEHAETLADIRRAGERAVELTRQLLAFARRQIVQPEVLDPNSRIRGVQRLLERLLGENIELRTFLAEEAWPIRIDPGQLEQLLVNLAVNARDAMPKGGTLTFETANVHLDEEYRKSHPDVQAGPYLQIVINDSGAGMSRSVQEHIFEPFYTTKDPGMGTGLGLATCHGIVKQNGGHIWLYSEPGEGTTFKIYFPRAEGEAAIGDSVSLAAEDTRGTETILVVEDEEMVRRIGVITFRQLGYRILEASTGAEALEVAAVHDGPIDAVVCDVVLPDMRGPEVTAKLAEKHPEARVLYVSGYTENTIVHDGVLEHGINFLQKPYTSSSVARALRRLLDGGE